MGRLTRIALLCLGLAGLSLGLECNVGSVNLDKDGKIVDSRIEAKQCFGLCTRRSPVMPNGSIMHILACEERDRTFEADDVCHEDLCNRVPGKETEIEIIRASEDNELAGFGLQCYVGIQVGSMALAGAVGSCTPGGYTGSCASATTFLGTYQATLFFCTSHGICDALVTPSPPSGTLACSGVNAHPDYNITACCCYDINNCNTQNFTVPTPLPTSQPSTRIPQACYEGIHIDGQLLAGGSYVACQGDCASVSFKYMGQYDFTMYSCDPANLCPQLGITNNCVDLSNGTLAGCCCNSDACIDPTISPPRYPNGTRTPVIECYAGVHIVNLNSKNSVDYGASLACDGMCGRLKTTSNGYGVEAFYCASYNLCYALNTVGSCANMTLAGMGVETCCCWDSPNCNTNNTDITPVPPTRIPRRDVIACFQGIHVNNFSIAESYTGCAGDCASLTVQSSLNGDPYNVTLYTCDPTTVCQGLGIINRCAQIPNTPISGCCCDSDVCINPYARRFPNGTTTLQCAVGLVVPGANFTDLYQLNCDGTCASVETTVGGTLFAGMFCAPTSTCKALDLRNDCFTILGDAGSNHVTACCCDHRNNCNAERVQIQPQPYTPATNRPPIACWAGLGINQNFFNNSGRYMACQGACGLMTFRTSIMGQDTNVTMYSCDPVDICPALGIQNSCGTSPTGVFTGCCCDWNDCIDVPNRKLNPYPLPSSVNCFIGVAFDGSNGTKTTYGGQMPCDGQCGTIVTDISGVHTYGYFCAPQALCSDFDVWNECSRSWLDWGGDWVDVCCCNNNDNCNINRQQPNVTIPTPSGPAKRRTPISCYSGLSFLFNGTNYPLSGDDKYMSCFGDCSQITYQSFVNGTNFLATMFTCDPVYLCGNLGMSNSCANISRTNTSSISGCCCNYNDCINKQDGTLNPMQHKDDLQCFVGLQLQSNPNDPRTRFISGSSMPCNGECAAINTNFNGYNTWAFMCAPQKLCDIFDTERECGNYPLDGGNNLQTCCCGMYDNCNLRIHNIPVPSVSPSMIPTGITPLACYAGLGVNGKIVSPTDRYLSCNGACATLTYTAQLNGNPFSATIFSCDPVTLCQGFNLVNNCTTIQDGSSNTTAISGCCCGFNDCIDKNTFMPKSPPSKDNLQCFVGLQLQSNPQNASTRFLTGASGGCNGECGTVNTHFNGYDMWAFLCAPPVLCNVFDPQRQCGTPLQMDSAGDYLEICCCGGTDNCNVYGHGFPVPTVLPTVDSTTNPLACYTGVALNRTVLTDDNRFMACQGDCASLTYSSRYNGNDFSATIFSCDPVALCGSFNILNGCTNLQNGGANDTRIRACCCNWNDCIDRSSNSSFSILPYPLPTSVNCFVGLSFQNGNSTTTYGGTMSCDGQCGSLVTNVNNITSYGYYCAPQALCSSFELWNACTRRLVDSVGDAVDICCCNAADNCNIQNQQPNVTIPTVPPPVSAGSPLACYSGLTFMLGGTFYNMTSSDRYMACNGACAAISYTTSVSNGTNFAATVFTCDPVSLCSSLGMNNQCVNITGSVGNGIGGCCCNWNDCINKQTGNSLNGQPTAPPPTGSSSSSIPFIIATIVAVFVSYF